jgi:hypothetical protein
MDGDWTYYMLLQMVANAGIGVQGDILAGM